MIKKYELINIWYELLKIARTGMTKTLNVQGTYADMRYSNFPVTIIHCLFLKVAAVQFEQPLFDKSRLWEYTFDTNC